MKLHPLPGKTGSATRAEQPKRRGQKIAFRRGDGLRLTIATAALFGTLVALFFAGGYTLRTYAKFSAAKDELAVKMQSDAIAKANREATRRRVGTIVIASDHGGCEELRFNNFTGAFMSIAAVDCDARLVASVTATNTQRDTGAGMRGMLDSFRK